MIKIERASTTRHATLAGAMLLVLAAADSARAAASFTCMAWPTQTCHYALVRDGAVRERFVVRSGGRVDSPDAQPGDAYMMSINFDPPETTSACSQAPHPELKRSRWCRLGQAPAGAQP